MGADQRRAVLAVVLSGIVLFSWQYFMGPQISTTQIETTSESSVQLSEVKKELTNVNQSNTAEEIDENLVNEYLIKNSKVSVTFNNFLSLNEIISDSTEKKFSEIFTSNNANLLFNINGILSPLYFKVEKVSDSKFKISNIENNIHGFVFADEKGYFKINLSSEKSFQYVLRLKENHRKLESGQQTQYLLYAKDLETVAVGNEDNGDKQLNWVGVDFNYHLFASILDKNQNYIYKSKENGELEIKPAVKTNDLSLSFIFSKKEYDHLIDLGNKLENSVDFGIWSLIAVPILRGLQFFFKVFPNYGISIILLTLIIRMLTFPLQYKSFKSMKKMQDIQPDLNKVREKFKDNPQKMQQETMALFRKAGANPLSGCLPLLLQMPIFFAFYKVLYSAVELVDAPFYLWIVDLSEKDPYYVLPVLMAVAMFFQQKLTPATTADPMQKKLMTFMPLMFAVFMKDLPAGLTLYIFVSTIVGMTQQLFVFKRA